MHHRQVAPPLPGCALGIADDSIVSPSGDAPSSAVLVVALITGDGLDSSTAAVVGEHTIKTTLITPDGHALIKTLSLSVRANDPEIATTRRFDLAGGDTFTFDANVFTGLRSGTASATIAANAGKPYLVTSQRELTDLFGDPTFYTDTNNNALHGSELNEYGLQAAYSYLGVANRAYVTRATLNTSELIPDKTQY